MADLGRFYNLWMRQQDALVRTRRLIQIKSKGLTSLQHLTIGVGKGPDTELGTLQIAQNGDGMLVLGLDLANDVQEFLLLGVLAVGEVETEHCKYEEKQYWIGVRRIRGDT